MESEQHSFGVQSATQTQKKFENNHKQSYEFRKRDPNSNLSEAELANKTMKDGRLNEDKDSGYGMLVGPESNFIMNRPVWYIARRSNLEIEDKEDACVFVLQGQEYNKAISRVCAKIFYSPKIGEFCIENVGKNAILVDRKSLKKSSGGSRCFRPLRNEACIQISTQTIFFLLPKEVLLKKKILRENRKTLLFDKISKLCQRQSAAKDVKEEQITAIKESSNEIFQDAPWLSIKDLVLLYKNNQLGLELPLSLQDKYFTKKKQPRGDDFGVNSELYTGKFDF